MTVFTALGVVLATAHLQGTPIEPTVSAQAASTPAATATPAAQQPGNAACLALGEAVDQALNYDPRIDAARASRQRARADVISAHSRNLPQLSAFGQAGLGDSDVPLDRRRDNQLGLQFSQEIYSFGERRLANDAARLSYRASSYGLEEQKNQIALATGQAYLEYARALAIVELSKEQTEAFRQDAEAAATRLERRVITLTDASQIRARYARSRSELVNARVDAETALTRLQVLSHDNVSCLDPKSIQSFVSPEAPRVLGLAPEAALDEALANSAVMRQAKSEVASARASLGAAKRSNLPTLSVDGYSLTYWEAVNTTTGDYTDQSNDHRIGLTLSQDIYTGGRNRARKLSAQAELSNARAQERLQRMSLDDAIRAALAQARARREAGIDLLEARDQARIQLDYTKREYDRGTKTLTDLVLANEDYFLAASQEVDARYSFYASLLELYSAMGLLGEDGLR